ncbi:MAG: aspartate ammonia-lyase [Thermodesulfobacteriota bacterium]
MKKNKKAKKKLYRIERDSLGERKVPATAYYGVQTLRAMENFPISGIKPKSNFIVATAMIKSAAAEANTGLGLIPKNKGRAVVRAAREIIDGRHHSEFVVDVYQAGAGTSHNMNANEVICNRALEILGRKKGDYAYLHPNDHVNMAQSTNDTFPTAMRIAALLTAPPLLGELKSLERELKKKARSFNGIIKSGRTHLQDAVPVRLGQEFASYAVSVKKSRTRIEAALAELKELPLGATAAGTGLNAHPKYRVKAVRALKEVSSIRGLKSASNLFEPLASMAAFTALSAALRNTAVELQRIAGDTRLLCSGPSTGLAEITLPAVQPGSSIMPGKVNPVMAEMLAMVCFQIIGNDRTVTMAASAGQLELNVMGPVINYNILQSLEIMTSGVAAFTTKAVSGIEADKERCREYFESSVGLATVLNVYIGYERAAAVAKEAKRTGRTVAEVIEDSGVLTKKEIKQLFDWKRIT